MITLSTCISSAWSHKSDIRFLFLHTILFLTKLLMDRFISSLKNPTKVHQLPLESIIRKDNWSSLSCIRHCFIKWHFKFLHEISDDTWCTSWYTSVTMDQYCTSRADCFLNELNSHWKVPHNVHIRHVQYVYYLIAKILQHLYRSYLPLENQA